MIMAGILAKRCNPHRLLLNGPWVVKGVIHSTQKCLNFLRRDVFKLSMALSLFLLILNFVVMSYGQNSVRSLVLPSKLQHGFMPSFPHHYFHHKDHLNTPLNQSSSGERVDRYIQLNIQRNSLLSDVPPVLHVVWCHKKYFKFSHYLSVLSGFKVIQPSVIFLHLLNPPEIDPDGYYQFLSDLRKDLPSLVSSRLAHKEACSSDPAAAALAYLDILGPTGGVVISGQTVLSPSPHLDDMLKEKASLIRHGKSHMPLVICAQPNAATDKNSNIDIQQFFTSKRVCANSATFSFKKKDACVHIEDDLFPVDIFHDEYSFGQLLRWVGYGTTQKMESRAADTDIVPNIVHYVWLGERYLDFFSYLSLLSCLHVLKADHVYIHGNYEPLGDYWKEAVKDKRVSFIHREFPASVYGEPIKKFASHGSDYLRADVLIRYGGIYADWDVIFVKPMSQSLRRHNTTVNVDWPKTGAFPDVINLGVLIAAPGAPFLRHFLESYRWYLDNHWSYNAIHMPYKVYEKVPSSLNVDRHLQVSCAVGSCHATFLAGYKNVNEDHLKSPFLNWRTDVFAFHWTHPDPEEFSDKQSLLKSTSIPGEIGQYVLQMAKMV